MFSRPTLTQLRDQVTNDILVGTGLPTLLRRSPLRAIGYGQAGLAHGQYGYLDWIARQSTPFTATGPYLEAWGALKGVSRLPASAATGTVQLTGTGTIPAGAGVRSLTGGSYVVQTETTFINTGTILIIAIEPGAAGTIDSNSTVALISPVSRVSSTGIAQSLVAGADQETDAALRTRILQRWAKPPQGGSEADYQDWALEVAGVTRVWVNEGGAGPGSVVVYTMWDIAEAGHAGFPQGNNGGATRERRLSTASGDLLAVADHIFLLRPVTARVYSAAPRPLPVDFNIQASGPVPAAVRTLVQQAIDAAFILISTPLGAALPTSPFEAAISGVPGMPAFSLLAPTAVISAPLGYLPVRGSVSYV